MEIYTESVSTTMKDLTFLPYLQANKGSIPLFSGC